MKMIQDFSFPNEWNVPGKLNLQINQCSYLGFLPCNPERRESSDKASNRRPGRKHFPMRVGIGKNQYTLAMWLELWLSWPALTYLVHATTQVHGLSVDMEATFGAYCNQWDRLWPALVRRQVFVIRLPSVFLYHLCNNFHFTCDETAG
jgi:hypothetical protein